MWRLAKKGIIGLAVIVLVFTGLMIIVNNWPFYRFELQTGFLLTKTEALKSIFFLPAFYAHIIASPIVLFCGLLQFSDRLRSRRPHIHRTLGKIYVVLILFVAAPGGFVMALYANGGWNATICFGLLAVLWIYVSWQAFIQAKRRDFDRHQRLMILSYALTISAPLLRVYSFIASVGFEWRGPEAYAYLIWLSWVPQLILVLVNNLFKVSRKNVY